MLRTKGTFISDRESGKKSGKGYKGGMNEIRDIRGKD